MSVELPEAQILAEQMNKELIGKQIRTVMLEDYERLQKIGFFNKKIEEFDKLKNGNIVLVVSRGNVIRIKIDNGMNLIIGLEYGGRIHYHMDEKNVSEKFHLRLDFSDDSILTTRLTGMGVIKVVKEEDLHTSYVYRRDFSETPSPLNDDLSFEQFSEILTKKNRGMKSILVGKDAIVVGLSNSAFQDIIYRAKIHPKRKGSDLSEEEKRDLFGAMKLVVRERLQHGGKVQFLDLYQTRGGYEPAMGPNMKQKNCPRCGEKIEKLSVGGGQVYLCPNCQK